MGQETSVPIGVVIFDDDAAIGRAMVRAATVAGMAAVAVTDVKAFEKCLRAGDPPKVVLLDLQLGNTDGIEQLRLLAKGQYAGKLVLMSGFDARVLATARALGESLGLNVESVLEKPLRLADLEQLFESLRTVGQPPTVERIREAIANDEMSLDFQPIVTRDPRALKKLEALVRWDHPISGRISPATFIPVAESDTTTIDALTDWVLAAAVDAYQVLAETGVRVPLAVNISTRNLHDLTLPDRIEQHLRSGGMPTQHLCLEITESAAFDDPTHTMDVLSRARLKGIRLSIDDFGTGFSSLKLLRRMPFTEIKIDHSFVSDITSSRDSRMIVKSIIDLAANMEMGCVAEGVETTETAQLLEQLGARDLQGYLFAPAMPVESVRPWQTFWMQSGSKAPRSQDPDPMGELASSPTPPVSGETGNTAVRLSPRQLDVMRILAEGRSVKEIARRLDIGIGTVKVHLALAYTSLGAHNRVEAIARAGPALLNTVVH